MTDTRLFFIECADNLGDRFFPERDTRKMTREQTIRDIADGQFGHRVVRILMVDGDLAFDCTRELLLEAAHEIASAVDAFMSSEERQEYYDRANKLMEVA